MTHWADKRERGSYRGIIFLLTAYRYGGRWVLRGILAPVITYFFLTGGSARRASLDYLRRLHSYTGAESPFPQRPGWRQSWYHFWQFGLAAMEKIDAWIGKLNPRHIRYHGDVTFKELAERQGGGILLGSHLGNLEVARALASGRYRKRMSVLVFTEHAQAFNKALRQVNPRVDIDLIQVTEVDMALTLTLKERIDQGEYVVIVGDRISVKNPEHSVSHSFLGSPADFAIGPWVLASVLECPVYLLFCMRKNQGPGYDVFFNTFRDQVRIRRRQRSTDLTEVLDDYVAMLEQIAKQYPYQWYNFYDFWQPAGSTK